jgi:mRNA interferase RelE/StbE
MGLIKVELERQVVDFIRSLPPGPRRAVRRGLKNLEQEKGDIRALEGELEGFYRLRINRYRINFSITFEPKAVF